MIDNPVGVAAVENPEENTVGPAQILLLGVLAAAFGSLALRFRRSRGEQRQQLKWFTYAAALVPLAVLDEFLPAPVDSLAFAVPVVLLPIAAGIAILRHRLYDIDRLINRTLVYGLFVSPRHIQQRTDCYQQAEPFARLLASPGRSYPTTTRLPGLPSANAARPELAI